MQPHRMSLKKWKVRWQPSLEDSRWNKQLRREMFGEGSNRTFPLPCCRRMRPADRGRLPSGVYTSFHLGCLKIVSRPRLSEPATWSAGNGHWAAVSRRCGGQCRRRWNASGVSRSPARSARRFGSGCWKLSLPCWSRPFLGCARRCPCWSSLIRRLAPPGWFGRFHAGPIGSDRIRNSFINISNSTA